MAKAALQAKVGTTTADVYLGLELGMDKWVLCFNDGQRKRTVELREARVGVDGVLEASTATRERWGLQRGTRVVCCYEAGRHGFWVQRELTRRGIECLVVDPASIELPRRRRNKTDKIDARKLSQLLLRYFTLEKDALRVVRVPTPDQEDERRPQRESYRLKKERTALINRIKGVLFQCGVRVGASLKKFVRGLNQQQQLDGQPLPPNLSLDVRHAFERLALIDRQLKELARARNARLKAQRERERAATWDGGKWHFPKGHDPIASKVLQLQRLLGIGQESSWLLVTEFFGWREFRNRRQVGGASGLAPTVSKSSTIEHEHGISRAGNPRVRWVMQEIAWGWLRHQPGSTTTRWFRRKFNEGRRRRRTGGTALSRRLLVELWRWVEFGILPEGAVLKAT